MEQRSLIEAAADSFRAALARKPAPTAFVGMDGFIDEIIHVVDKRQSFSEFTRVRTIGEYAGRLAAAAGKSTNVEFVIQQVKMGGNGPLLADALGRLGTTVHYVGAIGLPAPQPVFEPLARWGSAVSIANPGITLAAEFDDGKIMHGKMEGLHEVTWENLLDRLGGIAEVDRRLLQADMLGVINWTMTPHLTRILRGLSERVAVIANPPRLAFFDLCDPEKRTADDIRECMATIASFAGPHTIPILGLNEKESLEVCSAMDVHPGKKGDMEDMLLRCRRLSKATRIPEIVIHPRTYAVAFGPRGEGLTHGPVCESPLLTTGAGDHFNGGYAFARLIGLNPDEAIVIGKAVSGFYVREGRGPGTGEVLDFCARWMTGELDPWKQG